MDVEIPQDLLDRAARWADLKRWERRELGQELRLLGLAYREIREIIPVPRGTLSGWCRDLVLTAEQKARLKAMNYPESVSRERGPRFASGTWSVSRQSAQQADAR